MSKTQERKQERKARALFMGTTEEGALSKAILELGLQVGDLIVVGGGMRASGTSVVTSVRPPRAETFPYGPGYLRLSVSVTRHFPRPLDHWSEQMDTTYSWGVSALGLDPTAHGAWLAAEVTGGRRPHADCTLEWCEANGLQILSPPSPDILGGRDWVPLDRSTPDVYLTSPTEVLPVDPVMERRRREAAAVQDRVPLLKPGTKVYLQSLPEDPAATERQRRGTSGSSGTFLELGRPVGGGGGAAAAAAAAPETTSVWIQACRGERHEFRREVVVPRLGPYGGVRLWVSVGDVLGGERAIISDITSGAS